MNKQADGIAARRNYDREDGLSWPERKNRREAMAKYVAEQVNRGQTAAISKKRAAKFFGVSVEQIRAACRQFLQTSASVKTSKTRRK